MGDKGGAGNGGFGTGAGSDGFAYSGGGGGGGGNGGPGNAGVAGGQGGSGIVIIRHLSYDSANIYLTASTTGSNVLTTASGGYNYYKFFSPGTITF